jgi:predicted component of type VI protein secretion system
MRREGSSGPRLQRPVLVRDLGGRDPAVYPVRPGQPITIGRDDSNAVVIDSTFVSKAHAVIEWRGGECVVEDLSSANGTTVNGLPIQVSEIRAGDVIEVGDQRLVVKDLSPGRGVGLREEAPANKGLRLAIAAGATLILMTGLLAMVAPRGNAAAARPQGPLREVVVPERPATAPRVASTPAITALVQEALEVAKTSGVPVAEALFDKAQALQASGRLLEAQALYNQATEQSPPHPLADARLKQISQVLERAIAVNRTDAERASAALRHAEAATLWEQVLMLTDPSDPRHQQAQAGLDRAKEHLGNR